MKCIKVVDKLLFFENFNLKIFKIFNLVDLGHKFTLNNHLILIFLIRF